MLSTITNTYMYMRFLSFKNHVNFYRNFAKMSVFIQKMNPLTGINDWVVQNEDYDYHQEVARSAFADMLHDTERNQLYEIALKAAIEKMHAKGKKANVLDIGTGTGLLSMMAARHGADTITACEAFKPMSDCASKIITLNGYEGKIKIIPKRSTEIKIGPDGDLLEKCNILVTEVFDTELIGEGALSTFSHAHKELLEKDCITVPQSATIFAQLVECPLAQNWNKLKDIYDNDGEILIKMPKGFKECSGSAAVHDIQLTQLPESSINTIVSPIPVLRFDWSGRTPFVFDRSTINTVKAEREGIAQCVFMWWELQMDTEGKVILSCAPKWAHPLTKTDKQAEIPWRDHWMQAIYYLPKEIHVQKEQEIHLISCHAEYNLWFNLVSNLRISETDYIQPVCECAAHVAFSRTRIGQMNESRRRKKHLALMERHIGENTCALILSDGFYTALAAQKFGATKLYFVENNYHSRGLLMEVARANSLNNLSVISDLKDIDSVQFKEINMVIAEPHFLSSIIPWDNLLFLFQLNLIKKHLSNDVQIYPQKAVIKGVAMHFNDLHKIRCPLEKCEGFLMNDFDDLIQESSKISDDIVEAQPLWEYPGIALTEEVEIASISIVNPPEDVLKNHGIFNFKGNGDCNGIALWVEWHLDGSPSNIINTGPLEPIVVGQKISWDMYTRQGVVLFPKKSVDSVIYKFHLDIEKGTINFECK